MNRGRTAAGGSGAPTVVEDELISPHPLDSPGDRGFPDSTDSYRSSSQASQLNGENFSNESVPFLRLPLKSFSGASYFILHFLQRCINYTVLLLVYPMYSTLTMLQNFVVSRRRFFCVSGFGKPEMESYLSRYRNICASPV